MIKLCAFADEYGKMLDEQICALKQHHIKYVELRNVDGKNVADLSEAEAAACCKKLAEAGIAVWSIGSPLGKVDVAVNFNEYAKTVRHVCRLANIFKTQRIRMFSFYNAENCRDKVLDNLRQMVKIAAEYNVTLCHENEKEIYGDTLTRVLDIVKNVEGLHLVFDSANFLQCKQDVTTALDALWDKIDYFHVKDVNAAGDIVPAGYGNGRYEHILCRLQKDTVFTLEPHLAEFEGYSKIDNTAMQHAFEFENGKQAFNFAVDAFKDLLNRCGYDCEGDCYVKNPAIVRYGIIGLGNMGIAHMQNFMTRYNIPNAKVVAISDLKENKIRAICDKYPEENFQTYASGAQLIDNADVDAVIIAVPHYQHPELSIRALNRGLHVICEKPAGVYTKQVKEMVEVASHSKGLFTMMFNQRTNCVYRKMREIVQAGNLGQIKRINWIITDWYRTQYYYDSGDWRATWAGEGGGVLCNQSPHQLDLLQWVTGLMPQKVHAFCHFGKWHDIEVEDDVTAYLEYENGATGVFITSTGDAPGTNRFEILGTLGKLVLEKGVITLYQNEEDERDFNKQFKGGFGEPKCTVTQVCGDGLNLQHVGICRNFTNAILGREPLFVDGREGIRSVELMNAMLLSTWTNKAVTLPINDNLYYKELQKRVATSRKKDVGEGVVLDATASYGK